MAEKETDKTFLRRAAVGTGLVVGGALLASAIGQNIQRADNANALAELQKEKEQKAVEYVLTAQEAAKGTFTTEDSIGSFELKQGDGLETPALGVIEQSLGTDLFNDAKPLFYDALIASTQLYDSPQPGQEFYVVMTDIDPQADNGKEYLVVKPDQINHGVATELPVPETH